MVCIHANKCLTWHDALYARLENRNNPSGFHPVRVGLNFNDDQVGDSEPRVVHFNSGLLPARFFAPAPTPHYKSFCEDAYMHSDYSFSGFSLTIGACADSTRMRRETNGKVAAPVAFWPFSFSPKFAVQNLSIGKFPGLSMLCNGDNTQAPSSNRNHPPPYNPANSDLSHRLRFQITSHADDVIYRIQAREQSIILPNPSLSPASPETQSSCGLGLAPIHIIKNKSDAPPPLIDFALDSPKLQASVTSGTRALPNLTSSAVGRDMIAGSAVTKELANTILEDIKKAVEGLSSEVKGGGNPSSDRSSSRTREVFPSCQGARNHTH